MRTDAWIITAAVFACVTGQNSFAQREPNGTPGQPEPGIQRESPPPVATPPYIPRTESRTARDQSLTRVSTLIGANIQSQDGQKAGTIRDVVMAPQSQKLGFVVLGRGGLLGFGEQLVPVPWQAISFNGENYVLNVDRQKLQSAPTLQKDQYAELDRPEFVSRIYQFFDVQPEAVGSPGSAGGSQKGQEQPEPPQ